MRLLIREAMLSFRRAPMLSALSVTTIAFSLFVVGLFGLVALNLREALQDIENRVEVVAYLFRGSQPETVTLASQDIAAFPEVQSVTYVTEDEALERAKHELVEFKDAYQDLQTNPLPASLEIRLKPGSRGADQVAAVADRLKSYRFVEEVRYGREWVEKLDRLRNIFGFVGLVIGLAFAIVAVVIIGVTIRITVLQRKREIAVMRLVGATNNFIRGPFILEGAIKGLLGGILAVLMCYGAFLLFKGQADLATSGLVFFRPSEATMGLLFGTLIGLGGSLVSVGRHLKNV
ncbi:MAG: permease-like cell division protein FtsX [Gemmatimonadota bacterium]